LKGETERVLEKLRTEWLYESEQCGNMLKSSRAMSRVNDALKPIVSEISLVSIIIIIIDPDYGDL
jgi:hypothetical protein